MTQQIVARAVPLGWGEVDTDQIVPSTFLRRTTNQGWADALFATLRTNADFVLDDERYAGARILLGGDNFGCGSSREHAVWALRDHGFEAVVAPSFGDIFANNCVKNGLVPVAVSDHAFDALLDLVRAEPKVTLAIDLRALTVTVPGRDDRYDFLLDPVAQHMLITGVDEIGLSLEYEDELRAHESRQPEWLMPIIERTT